MFSLKRVSLIVFFILSSFLSIGIANEEKMSGGKIEHLSPSLYRIRFPNGLKIIFKENPSSDTVAIQAWVKTGSRYEENELNGISHFIEHLLFKGSYSYSAKEIRHNIMVTGGYINALTLWENTKFYLLTPNKDFTTAFDILSDMIFCPRFSEKAIELERKVVLEEIRESYDDPRIYALTVVTESAFPSHPLGRPIFGTPDTVNRISRKDLLAYYLTHYKPENITFVIVGDLKFKQALTLLEKILIKKLSINKNIIYKWNRNEGIFLEKRKENEPAPSFTQKGLKRVEINRLLLQAYFALGIKTSGVLPENRYKIKIIDALLCSERNSRIYKNLKEERGIIDMLDSITITLSDTLLWGFYVGTSTDEIKSVEESVLKEIGSIKKFPVTNEELILAKRVLEGKSCIEFETNQGLASFYGENEALGNLIEIDNYLEKIADVSQEDILRASEEYFRQSNQMIFYLKPLTGVKKFLALWRYW